MSDNYPGRYNPNTDCLYIIQPHPGLYKLAVDVFQMADTGDFLQVILIVYSLLLNYGCLFLWFPKHSGYKEI